MAAARGRAGVCTVLPTKATVRSAPMSPERRFHRASMHVARAAPDSRRIVPLDSSIVDPDARAACSRPESLQVIQKSSTSAALILLHHSRHTQALGRSGECCGVRLMLCWRGHAAVVPMHSHQHAMRPQHDRHSWRRRSDTVAWAVCSGAICGDRSHEHGTTLVQTDAAMRAIESHDSTSSPESLPDDRKSHQLTQRSKMVRGNSTQALK